MKTSNEKRADQLNERILDGLYGEEVKWQHLNLKNIANNPVEGYLKYINDLYSEDLPAIFRPYPIALVEVMSDLYMRNHGQNLDLPFLFSKALFSDVLNTKGSCISDKFQGMIDAYFAFKQALQTKNKLIIWELAKSCFLSYNEFLNGISGLILINLRAANGLNFKSGTLNSNYGVNYNQLKDLIPQTDSYKTLLEVFRPDIRNAIGHQSIWYEESTMTVIYKAGKDTPEEKMSLDDFIFLNSKASHLAQAYIAGLCVMGLFSSGTIQDKMRLPKELFQFLMTVAPPVKA